MQLKPLPQVSSEKAVTAANQIMKIKKTNIWGPFLFIITFKI